jgi:hypothetical protein
MRLPRPLTIFEDSALLPHLLRPARGAAAVLILVFAALLTLATNAGLMGIPLAIILLSWLFKYAYILFDHVVRGVDVPPTLDIQMVNPLNEQRPLAQLIILLAIGSLVAFGFSRFPWVGAVFLAAFAALILPASVAVLGLEGNLLKAVNPLALTHMVAGLGPTYAKLLAIIAGYAALLALTNRLHLWLPVELTIAMFAVLSVFSALGGALYERRDDLGLEAWHSPERKADRERQEQRVTDQAAVTTAYGLLRVGAHVKAWETLQTWLTSRGHEPAEYRWLCDAVSSWPDSRYATRLTEEFVDRLLQSKRTGEALDAVARRLKADPAFRPKSAAATLQIAQLAVRGGGTLGVARVLLADFAVRFAGSPLVPAAATLARHLGD